MPDNTNLSIAASGSPEWPRYLIVNGAGRYWNDLRKEWVHNQSDASTFANFYMLKSVVSQIEEQSHSEKRTRCYEGTVVVKVRCDEDFNMEDLQFHLAKCVNIRVHSCQPDRDESIQDAWISVELPWVTLTEISEEEHARFDD